MRTERRTGTSMGAEDCRADERAGSETPLWPLDRKESPPIKKKQPRAWSFYRAESEAWLVGLELRDSTRAGLWAGKQPPLGST